jgi:hypothetical protein
MDITVKFTQGEAQKIIGDRALENLNLLTSHEADVNISGYSGATVTLSPKKESEIIPPPPIPAPAPSSSDDIPF